MDLASLSQYEDWDFYALFKKIENSDKIWLSSTDTATVFHDDWNIYSVIEVSDDMTNIIKKKRRFNSRFELYTWVVRTRSVNRSRVFEIIEIDNINDNNNDSENSDDLVSDYNFKEAKDNIWFHYAFCRLIHWKDTKVIDIRWNCNFIRVFYEWDMYEVFSVFSDSFPDDEYIKEFLTKGFLLSKVMYTKFENWDDMLKIIRIIK